MPEPTPTRSPRAGRIPVVVVAATLAFGALAAVWSVVAPLGEAPDEPAHLALVLHLADGNPYPEYDGLTNQAAILRLCKTYAAATRACPREGEPVTRTSMRRHPADEAPDKATRPAWDDEGGARLVGGLNQMPQHPPLYYQAMASVLRVERAIAGGPMSVDRELALLRLVNAALLAPLPLIAWWAARRFRLDQATAVAAALAVFTVPMLTHIGSTLNNDNLLTVLGAGIVALCTGVLRGDRSLRTALGLGVLTALALLTKAFAIIFPPIIVLAYLLGAIELAGVGWGQRLRALVKPVAVVAGSVLVLAGWWYAGVRMRTGKFAPTVESQRLTEALQPPGFEPKVGEFLGELIPNVHNRFWGSFGWYTIRFSGWLALACTVLVAVAVVASLVPRRDASGSSRLQRAFLLVPMIMLGLVVTARAWSLYVRTSKFQFMQGRYLFAGIVGLVVLASISLGRWLGRAAAGVVAVLAVLIQLEAVRQCLRGWWGGPGLGPRGQVKALVAWSAWPGEALAVLGVVALGLGAWLAFELVRFARDGASDVDPGPEIPVGGPVGSIAT